MIPFFRSWASLRHYEIFVVSGSIIYTCFYPRPSDRIVCECLASQRSDVEDKYQWFLQDSMLQMKILPHVAFVLDTPRQVFFPFVIIGLIFKNICKYWVWKVLSWCCFWWLLSCSRHSQSCLKVERGVEFGRIFWWSDLCHVSSFYF